jgi:hypothetical protein
MINSTQSYDVIVDFWEWYRRREANRCNPLKSYALDRCEKTFRRCEWNNFGDWYAIYLRERPRPLRSPEGHS